jgi:hypothetical protein
MTPPFPCGHRRTKKNQTGRPGHWSCRACKQQRDRDRRAGMAPKVIRLERFDLRDFAPRHLPINDTAGRSYQLAPSRAS